MTHRGLIVPAVLALLVIAFMLTPVLLPSGVNEIYGSTPFLSPGSGHPLGTDYLGRDLLLELIRAGGTTVSIAMAATVISVTLGFGSAVVVALLPGALALLVARLLDALVSIPGLIIAAVMVTGLGSSVVNIVAVITVVEFCRVYRAMRVPVEQIVAQPFFEMSRMRGESFLYIAARDIWMNLRAYASVELIYRFIAAIMLLSSLSLLGLGLQPPQSD